MKLVAVVATALCFTSLLSFALAAKDPKTVEGLVYCDSCRVKYKTELSDYIAGNSQLILVYASFQLQHHVQVAIIGAILKMQGQPLPWNARKVRAGKLCTLARLWVTSPVLIRYLSRVVMLNYAKFVWSRALNRNAARSLPTDSAVLGLISPPLLDPILSWFAMPMILASWRRNPCPSALKFSKKCSFMVN